MKVAHQCGYYSELAVKAGSPRPRDPPFWESYMYCHAVKSGEYHHNFYIIKPDGSRLNINTHNIEMVRPAFGDWLTDSIPRISTEELWLVPVPSKDCFGSITTYRSLEMARQALAGTAYNGRMMDAMRWIKRLPKAHQGGPRKRDDLVPLLDVRETVKGKRIVLVDDLITTGASSLACKDTLETAGGKVLGVVACGRTVYDAKDGPFTPREFDLTHELSDWRG